ncbi:MAG: glutamate synthase central domain-containing protein, partial [Chthoniobacterales bacterium]
REEMVMSLISYIGQERNILQEEPINAHTLRLEHPVLTNADLERLRRVSKGDFLATTLPALYRVDHGEKGLQDALNTLCRRASLSLKSGYTILILSDRGVDEEYAPIPSLLALTAVHNHLVRESTRSQCALVAESGEPREVMHFALLIGYGASAVNPYLAIETLEDFAQRGYLPEGKTFEIALKNYKKSINKGLLKTFSKMGISTLQSYRGAQVFEALGLNKSLVQRYFTGTPSRIEGIGLDVIAREAQMKHEHAFRPVSDSETELAVGGNYAYRVDGERHLLNPFTISKLQHAVRQDSFETFKEYTDYIDNQNEKLCNLRGLLRFKKAANPVPIEEVEPASEIVRRFATG